MLYILYSKDNPHDIGSTCLVLSNLLDCDLTIEGRDQSYNLRRRYNNYIGKETGEIIFSTSLNDNERNTAFLNIGCDKPSIELLYRLVTKESKEEYNKKLDVIYRDFNMLTLDLLGVQLNDYYMTRDGKVFSKKLGRIMKPISNKSECYAVTVNSKNVYIPSMVLIETFHDKLDLLLGRKDTMFYETFKPLHIKGITLERYVVCSQGLIRKRQNGLPLTPNAKGYYQLLTNDGKRHKLIKAEDTLRYSDRHARTMYHAISPRYTFNQWFEVVEDELIIMRIKERTTVSRLRPHKNSKYKFTDSVDGSHRTVTDSYMREMKRIIETYETVTFYNVGISNIISPIYYWLEEDSFVRSNLRRVKFDNKGVCMIYDKYRDCRTRVKDTKLRELIDFDNPIVREVIKTEL